MERRHGFGRIAVLSVVFSALVVICCIPVSAGTITVCHSGCNYTSIQDAIDHASAGDTIEVMNGTYFEHVKVNKSLAINGEDPARTVISGNYSGDVVTITASDVTFSGFTVTKGSRENDPNVYFFGIGAYDGSNISIESCRVTDSSVGIYAKNTRNLTLSGNEISGCAAQGMLLDNHTSSRVLSNRMHDNQYGLMGSGSVSLVCTGNDLTHNQYDGLCFIDGITKSVIEGNFLRDNCYLNFNSTGDYNQAGGYLEFVSGTTISNNTFNHNGGLGLFLSQMQQSVLRGNVMDNNYAGFSYNDGLLHPHNTIALSNTVDGSPVLYVEDESDRDITGGPFSSVYLISCRNVHVHDLTLPERNGLGITARGGSGIHVDRNTVSGNVFQDILYTAVFNGSITQNLVTGSPYGIGAMDCVNVTVSGNTASGNDHGLGVATAGHWVHLTGNTLRDNNVGVSVEFAESDGTDEGISCEGNLISGTPSWYSVGVDLMDSRGIFVHHNGISGLYEGIWIDGGEHHNASYNSIDNCTFGIEVSAYATGLGEFDPARDNIITGNTVYSDRSAFFTDPGPVHENKIFLNSFLSRQEPQVLPDLPARDGAGVPGAPALWGLSRRESLPPPEPGAFPGAGEPNIFNTTAPVIYRYHDIYFSGYLGNYWNWSTGTDTSGNGVRSTPYRVRTNNTDFFPLVDPVSAYAVGPAPSFYANFTASPLRGDAPLTVRFTDTSTGSPLLWLYKFGDGFTSTAKNPLYTYRVPGNYSVSLTIWKMDGSRLVNTTTEKTGFITVTGPPVPALAANFTAAPLAGPAPLTVAFTDTSAGSPDYWNYTFGDGSSSTAKNPWHTFQAPGNYTVSLTVMEVKDGTLIRNTTVKENLIAVSGKPGQLLSANFTAAPLTGPAPLRVTFTDTSTGSPDYWNYSFGDGTSSTLKNPSHTYLARGNYTVSLTVLAVRNGVIVRNTTVVRDLVSVQ